MRARKMDEHEDAAMEEEGAAPLDLSQRRGPPQGPQVEEGQGEQLQAPGDQGEQLQEAPMIVDSQASPEKAPNDDQAEAAPSEDEESRPARPTTLNYELPLHKLSPLLFTKSGRMVHRKRRFENEPFDLDEDSDSDSVHEHLPTKENRYYLQQWKCSKVLAQFIAANSKVFKESIVLELGCGAEAIPGVLAGYVGAKKIYASDHPDVTKHVQYGLEKTAHVNGKVNLKVVGLEWGKKGAMEFIKLLDQEGERLDFIIASDVFYDPKRFLPLIETIDPMFKKFPDLRMYFTFENRDDNYSIEDLLFLHDLRADHIRTVEATHSGDTQVSEVQIGVIHSNYNMNMPMFAGIEGGATGTKLSFINEKGDQVGTSDSTGSNFLLNSVPTVGDQIAQWIRTESHKNNVTLPLTSLVLGLSGAESEDNNKLFVKYLKDTHGDIAVNVQLLSDSHAALLSLFPAGFGIAVISGTGSSVRLRMDQEIHGAGGWGHLIGDGGSAFWIAQRAIRIVFDHEDGLEISVEPIDQLKKLILEHFKVNDKTGILKSLYDNFDKAKIAQLTKTLALHTTDPVIAKLFEDAGQILGQQVRAVLRHVTDPEKRKNIPCVLIGSTFDSWDAMKNGFEKDIKLTGVAGHMTIFRKSEDSALAIAQLAANLANVPAKADINAIMTPIHEIKFGQAVGPLLSQ